MQAGSVRMYHERQRRYLCLLHALNNLEGERAFTQKELNRIADNLPAVGGTKWWNPFSFVLKRHRVRWLGNYDANVLEGALATRGKEIRYYDRRNGADWFIPTVATYGDNFVGIILNVPSGGRRTTRHWVAVRRINGLLYNLDSRLDEPEPLRNLESYLDWVFSNSGDAIIVLNMTNVVNSS